MSISVIVYKVDGGVAGISPKIPKGRHSKIMEQQAEDHELEQRLMELEQRIFALEGERPKTDLLRRGFLGRAFGLWGYVILAQVIIVGVVYAGLAAVTVVMALLSGWG